MMMDKTDYIHTSGPAAGAQARRLFHLKIYHTGPDCTTRLSVYMVYLPGRVKLRMKTMGKMRRRLHVWRECLRMRKERTAEEDESRSEASSETPKKPSESIIKLVGMVHEPCGQ
jgi:hypothetical protein